MLRREQERERRSKATFNSKQSSPPQHYHIHNEKRCQGLDRKKTQTLAKINLYNCIYLCICREEKLGV